MIYPDQYKCLTCKFRYYACKHRKTPGMLSCSRYTFQARRRHKNMSMALARCFFGVCPSTFKLLNYYA